jgi:hypothetical protein
MRTLRITTGLAFCLSCGLGSSCARSTENFHDPQQTPAAGNSAFEAADNGLDGALECRDDEPGVASIEGNALRGLGSDSGLIVAEPGSDQADVAGGATVSYKTCSDMYFTCQEKGGSCTKKYPGCDTWGQSACGTCYQNCQARTTYPKPCKCATCGFTE